MSQDSYASVGLTTDYRRLNSSSMSGRITLQNDPRHSFLLFSKTAKVHPALCEMLIVLLSELRALRVALCTLCLLLWLAIQVLLSVATFF
jgi:hypothetical protein